MRYLHNLLRLSAILAVSACSDSSGPDSAHGVTVLLTDAPGDVLEAVVTIEQIYLQGGAAKEKDGGGGRAGEPARGAHNRGSAHPGRRVDDDSSKTPKSRRDSTASSGSW